MDRKKREYTYEEYEKAMDMLREGYKPSEVSRILKIKEYAIYNWKRGTVPPAAKWKAEPCIKLAYVIGSLEDGCVNKNEFWYQYRIILAVIDPEFATAFSRTMSRLLGVKYHKPRWSKKRKVWVVEYKSKAFYTWYKRCEEKGLEGFKPYIEHSKSTVAAFLRGLYDAEGYNDECKRIYLSNTNVKLLRYVQYLLSKYFDIDTRGPYLTDKAGTIHTKRNGEKIKSKHDGYQIHINKKEHVQRFLNEVGFTITRKQLGLKKKELVKQGFFRPLFSDTQ